MFQCFHGHVLGFIDDENHVAAFPVLLYQFVMQGVDHFEGIGLGIIDPQFLGKKLQNTLEGKIRVERIDYLNPVFVDRLEI
jgi:hypothetical protein